MTGTAQVKSTPTFLGKEVRVTVADGRIFTGILICFQGGGDLILMNVTEFRQFTAEMNHGVAETVTKQSHVIAIPFKHIVSMHQRKDGCTEISEVVSRTLQSTGTSAALGTAASEAESVVPAATSS